MEAALRSLGVYYAYVCCASGSAGNWMRMAACIRGFWSTENAEPAEVVEGGGRSIAGKGRTGGMVACGTGSVDAGGSRRRCIGQYRR